MTWSTGPGDAAAPPSSGTVVPGGVPHPVPGVAAPEVVALMQRLDGVAERPLEAQVELLDGVRRGLDDVLARPSRDPG